MVRKAGFPTAMKFNSIFFGKATLNLIDIEKWTVCESSNYSLVLVGTVKVTSARERTIEMVTVL